MCFEQPLLQNSPTVLRRGHWSGLCSANDRARLDAFLRRTKRYGYCSEDIATISDLFSAADESLFKRVLHNDLHVLQPLLPAKPVSVTIYVLVATTDNYLESLLTLMTLASSSSSLECSTLTHINCLLLSFTLTFIVCIVYVAICQLF